MMVPVMVGPSLFLLQYQCRLLVEIDIIVLGVLPAISVPNFRILRPRLPHAERLINGVCEMIPRHQLPTPANEHDPGRAIS